MKTQATIVGAGIGGLAAAVHLQARGWQVTIHERARALPESGTALAIWPAALRALDSLGLGGQARDLGPAPSASTFMRWNGHRIGRLDLVALQRRTGDSLRLLSRRALLRLRRRARAGDHPFRLAAHQPRRRRRERRGDRR